MLCIAGLAGIQVGQLKMIRSKAHKYDSEEAKRMHVSTSFLEKTIFPVIRFEPDISSIRTSDASSLPRCSHNLSLCGSIEFIYTKT
jgi:hypothetical protein